MTSEASLEGPETVADSQSVKDRLPDVLHQVDQYNPPFLIRPPNAELLPTDHGAMPFNFYDRHLDDALSLKRIVPLSELPTYFSKKVDDILDDLKKQGTPALPLNDDTESQFVELAPLSPILGHGNLTHMSTRALGYALSVGEFSVPLASAWIVHPRTNQYYSTLQFDYTYRDRATNDSESVISCYSARFSQFLCQRPEVLSSMDDHTKAALKDLEEKDLITCLFFPMCTEMDQIFADMGRLDLSKMFSSYSTSTFPPLPTHERKIPPCDALNTPWVLPQLSPMPDATPPRTSQMVDPKRRRVEFTDAITAGGIIHNAWHRSVQDDTTIIMLNCGNYERIGIRHRESQTLFLSDRIEVWQCQNPSYGRLHLGLICSAISDALDRHKQGYLRKSEVISKSPSLKRPRESDDDQSSQRNTRQRIEDPINPIKYVSDPSKDSNRTALIKAITPRSLALLSIKYQEHNSPVPAPCLRIGGMLTSEGICANTCPRSWNSSYQDSEWYSLTLLSDLSGGATGRVHAARLEVTTTDGVHLSEEVIVKTAVDHELQVRVRHEYKIYRHLWKQGVPRIPVVYGLFHDIDRMVTFLVIEKLGMSFRDREPVDELKGRILTCVSPDERSVCFKNIEDIHQAGVIHRDLRAENILFAPDGKPMIIDFDRARLNPTASQLEVEIERLSDLLDGTEQGSLLFSTADFRSGLHSDSDLSDSNHVSWSDSDDDD